MLETEDLKTVFLKSEDSKYCFMCWEPHDSVFTRPPSSEFSIRNSNNQTQSSTQSRAANTPSPKRALPMSRSAKKRRQSSDENPLRYSSLITWTSSLLRSHFEMSKQLDKIDDEYNLAPLKQRICKLIYEARF